MSEAERERIDQMVQRRINAANAHLDRRQHKLDTWDGLLANTDRLEKELWQNAEVYKADMAWAREDFEKLTAERAPIIEGEDCPTCGQSVAKSGKTRQKEYRERKKG